MFKLFFPRFTFLILCLLLVNQTAWSRVMIPAPPKVGATAYILVDANSGKVIVSERIDTKLPPASITKMMTDYIAAYEMQQGNLNLDDEVYISENAWKTQGSRMYINVGSKVTVSDLLKGIVVQSGNDASVALAEHIAGSEEAFADIMNQHAGKLGMKNTHFVNATGWPADDHYTTAEDLVILAKAIINNFPEHYKLYSQKDFKYNNIKQANRNKLLWRDKSVDGMKTGHTEAAGYCLVSSAKQDDMRLIAVVLGTKSEEERLRASQTLLSYGFRYYETHKLHDGQVNLHEADVWKGETETLKAGISEDLYITTPKGTTNQWTVTLNIDEIIEAPVEAGQEVGTVNVMLAEELLLEKPLIALESVNKGGFFKCLWDAIKLFFYKLFN